MWLNELARGGALGIIIGVAIALWTDYSSWIWIGLALGVSGLTLWPRAPLAWALAWMCLGAGCGGLLAEQALTVALTRTLPAETVAGQFQVTAPPVLTERTLQVRGRFVNCTDTCPIGTYLVTLTPYSSVSFGDRLELSCSVTWPQDDQSGYAWYLAKEGINGLCRPAVWARIGAGEGPRFQSGLFALRERLENNLRQSLPQPASGLVSGILFGGKGSVSQETETTFQAAGLSHIVAVSGYNVTLVANYCLWGLIAVGCRRKQAVFFVLLAIMSYVILTGASASAVRAGVMGSLCFIALHVGRLGHTFTAWLLAGAVMLMWNPLLLRYDIGFQLSFLATLAILCYVEWRGSGHTGWRAMARDVCWTTFAAELAVTPLLMWYFGSWSVVAFPANVFVLTWIPGLMGLGFCLAVIGGDWPMVSPLLTALVYTLASLVTESARFFASLPFAQWTFEAVAPWFIFLWYGVVVSVYYLFRPRRYFFRPVISDSSV